ncbi:LuxR C-terminal-related transcriptional regulator [Saccharothrix sp. AJ9571]|nr:LuxR C-terminal-related transcriptional regulator [Saccharothrix sp. AJ9571]
MVTALASKLLGGAKAGQRITEASVLGLLSFLRVQQQAEALIRRELGDDEFENVVVEGESLGPAEVYTLATSAPLSSPRKAAVQEMRPGGLSEREYEVSGLIAKGMRNREIAKQLGISFRTVEEHIRRINRRLGLANRVEIAAWYLKEETAR